MQMDRFQQMQVFQAVADAQGFAGGARRLGLSAPVVTRAVAALEEALGVRLFYRTTRHVRLTDAGQRYLDDVRRILLAVQEADDAAAGINAEPRGQLVLTAPVLFGKLYVMPQVAAFMQQYPAVAMSCLFLDRVVNMLEEGVDVGIRIGELPDSSLRAVRVGQVRRVLVAAPAYLAQHGMPQHIDDLARHQIVAASAISPTQEWQFATADGNRAVRLQPRLTVTSNDSAIAAACAGMGITRVLSYQVTAQLAAGELQRVLPGSEPPALPIHVLHREERGGAAKVRAFVDFISAALRQDTTLA